MTAKISSLAQEPIQQVAPSSLPVTFPPLPEVPQMYWTREHYHRAIEAGVLTEDDPVELIFGKLVLRTAVGKIHAATVDKISDYSRPVS